MEEISVFYFYTDLRGENTVLFSLLACLGIAVKSRPERKICSICFNISLCMYGLYFNMYFPVCVCVCQC